MRYRTTRKQSRTKRQSRRKLQSRKQRGGNDVITVDLRQLLITNPIFNAVDSVRQLQGLVPINRMYYARERRPEQQGLPLPRLKNVFSVPRHSLPPITIEPTEYSRKVEGNKMRLYTIVDGRHRVARAIIEGRETIPAIVVNGI